MFPNGGSHTPYSHSSSRYIVTGFIDKNKDPIYQDFKRLLYNRSEVTSGSHDPSHDRHMISYSDHKLLKAMWPEGAQALTEVTKRPKSAGTRHVYVTYSLYRLMYF